MLCLCEFVFEIVVNLKFLFGLVETKDDSTPTGLLSKIYENNNECVVQLENVGLTVASVAERRSSNRKVADPWSDFRTGNASLRPRERHSTLISLLGQALGLSSLPFVVAQPQPDKRLANGTQQNALCWCGGTDIKCLIHTNERAVAECWFLDRFLNWQWIVVSCESTLGSIPLRPSSCCGREREK